MAEITDPTLIAQLEQPQTEINKGGGAGATAPYSQSALDAFDRAIGTARRLKTHPGFGASVGSGFDPQSWGSFSPLTGEAIAGTNARDFKAELEAMKAQVFLPMVQSMKGMGALSNAEGQKLTDAIGALDPGMSEDAFKASLNRIIGDLAEYRNRGAPDDKKLKLEEGEGGLPAPAPPTGPGDIGFNTPDQPGPPLTPPQQAAYDAFNAANPLATAEQLRAFGVSIGVDINNAEAIVAARDKGAGVRSGSDAVPGLTAEEQAKVAEAVGKSDAVGAGLAGAADTITMGTLDKAGAAIDAVGQSMGGEGSFGDNFSRNRLVNDAILEGLKDDHPWAYTGGQVAGGFVLPLFSARTPAQLAKVGAAYGAAYGAGSSDSLAEVPGNVAAGAAIGVAAGWGGGKLIEKLEQRVARKAAEAGVDASEESAETAATRYARGQQFGIDLSVGDVRGMGSKAAERVLDVQPGSAGVMNKARGKVGEQVEQAVEDVAGDYGPATSFRGLGEAAQRGAKSWISKFEDVSSKAYGAIPIKPDAEAATGGTVTALRELNTIFESNPRLAYVFKNSKLNEYLNALDKDIGGNGLSWNDLKAFRSRIGEEIGDQRFSDSPTKSELRRLYGALSEDMRVTAMAQGPQALKAFERANDLYRAGQQRIEGALTKILGDDSMMSPEKAAARIQALVKEGKSSADLNLVHEVWKSLPAQERGEVANGLIRLMGQPLNSEGRAFNAQTFIKNYDDMADAAKNLIFGATDKELRTNLDEFSKVIRDVAGSNATRNTSNTGMALAGGAGLLTGGLPGLLIQTATSYGAARLWTNPKFIGWATGYAKMSRGAAKAGKAPSEEGIKTQARLLDKLAASEPGIAQDLIPLKQWLLSAANENVPAQAAASDENQQ